MGRYSSATVVNSRLHNFSNDCWVGLYDEHLLVPLTSKAQHCKLSNTAQSNCKALLQVLALTQSRGSIKAGNNAQRTHALCSADGTSNYVTDFARHIENSIAFHPVQCQWVIAFRTHRSKTNNGVMFDGQEHCKTRNKANRHILRSPPGALYWMSASGEIRVILLDSIR